jgi:hypothetical protein
MDNTDKLRTDSLEYNLTEHCNLKCAGCDHASPHLPAKFASLDDFRRDMEALATVLHAKELKFVGGEPLLHPQLLEFIREARRIRISNHITLITNGVLLHTLSDEAWPLIDIIWLSIYPGVKYKFEMGELEAKVKKHNVRFWKKDTPAFFLTLLNKRIENPTTVERIYRNCYKRITCHTVYEGRYFKCAPAALMQKRLALIDIPFPNKEADGVRIHDNPALRAELSAFLSKDEPLEACSYCLGDSGPVRPYQQLSKKGREADLAEDHGPAILGTELRVSIEHIARRKE